MSKGIATPVYRQKSILESKISCGGKTLIVRDNLKGGTWRTPVMNCSRLRTVFPRDNHLRLIIDA